jgi:SAM-dependent methyltransferase
MSRPFAYAQPQVVDDPSDCLFYHRMDIPGVGEVGGLWDLRAVVETYVGQIDFTGKRLLDVGAASGYLSFEMEKRGAEVVSFDLSDGRQWDIVPHHSILPQLDEVRASRQRDVQRLKNAYWFSHRRLGSRAKVYYGDIYDLPADLGLFDVVFFGMVLSHLRDPFQALFSAARLCRGTVVITNQMFPATTPTAVFLPNSVNQDWMSWWGFSDKCLAQMLEVLGFEVKATLECDAACYFPGREGLERCLTLVALRSAGTPCLETPAYPWLEAA